MFDGKGYIYKAMSTTVRNDIRREVLKYLRRCEAPVRISNMATELRTHPRLGSLRESDVRAVVQPMIVTGALSYAPGLKIKLADSNK
jgi:hypothetical protein